MVLMGWGGASGAAAVSYVTLSLMFGLVSDDGLLTILILL